MWRFIAVRGKDDSALVLRTAGILAALLVLFVLDAHAKEVSNPDIVSIRRTCLNVSGKCLTDGWNPRFRAGRGEPSPPISPGVGRPPEATQDSAAPPLAPEPRLGQKISPGLYS